MLGSCYHVSRQETLGEAYEFLNDYNRPVFVKLEKVPDNKHDKNAIGVFLMTRDEYVLVGYIASELTKYLHPLMDKKQLDVDVKHIRFCTTYLRMGFYLTIDITKHGMWPDEVVTVKSGVLFPPILEHWRQYCNVHALIVPSKLHRNLQVATPDLTVKQVKRLHSFILL